MKRLAEDTETVVKFNAGGTHYSTLLRTLRRSSLAFPDSVFAILFEGDEWLQHLQEGAYFIDRDSETFRAVLQVLRYPHMASQIARPLPRELWHSELESWGLVQPQLKRLKVTAPEQPQLQELGRDVRRRLVQTEQQVVQQLLEKTGFSAPGYRIHRVNTLLVPLGVAPVGEFDMASHIAGPARVATKRLLENAMAPCHVEISATGKKRSVSYVYDGVEYNTGTQLTVQVVIELEECVEK